MVKRKYVLVTGTSTGLGNALAHLLAKQNYQVLAAVRTENDKQQFLKTENIIPVILDVTIPAQIDKVFDIVKNLPGSNGLYALINNAGINYVSAFELADEQQERALFEVNLFGAMALTRKMLPLLHQYVSTENSRAGIINIASIGAIFGLPWESSYHASKFALLGWSQSLRYELEGLNISVSCFLPGGMKTQIFQKSVGGSSHSRQDQNNLHYAYYRKNQQHMNQVMAGFEKASAPAHKAAGSIARLLGKKTMPAQKYFGKDAQFLRFATWIGLTGLLKNRFIKK